jgi:hypothetical protein
MVADIQAQCTDIRPDADVFHREDIATTARRTASHDSHQYR